MKEGLKFGSIPACMTVSGKKMTKDRKELPMSVGTFLCSVLAGLVANAIFDAMQR